MEVSFTCIQLTPTPQFRLLWYSAASFVRGPCTSREEAVGSQLFISVLLALVTACASAQDAATGLLRGRVLNASGGAISSASITLTLEATGAQRQTSSDD